jgi:signal transduction histidine kinase
MEISWCKNRLARLDEAPAREFMMTKTETMGGLIDETIRTVRRIASELRPGVLDELGLEAAIDWLARDFQSRSGIECEVQTEEVQLDKDRSTAMFRVCQEALTNVARHAAATRVSIRLERDEDDLVLRVRDNGRGIRVSEQTQTKSLGILGMRERASLAGGELSIERNPDQGTSVVMRLHSPVETGF